jgi:hypothetical protein
MFRRTLQCLKQTKVAESFPANYNRTPANITDQRAVSISPTAFSDEFFPNPKIVEFAAKSKIAFPNALRKVSNRRFKEYPLHFSVCGRHVFSGYHVKYLGMFEHPLTEKTLYFYTQEKKKKPLWCYVQGTSSQDGSTVVVRTTSERMVWKALIHAMNALGYDLSGNSLNGENEGLQGTIRISVASPKKILMTEFDGLVGHLTDSLVTQFIPHLKEHIRPPPKYTKSPLKGRIKASS